MNLGAIALQSCASSYRKHSKRSKHRHPGDCNTRSRFLMELLLIHMPKSV
jgi:hypothetical protein